MDLTTITNYLVENGEFVDDNILQDINLLLSSTHHHQLNQALNNFFSSKFPDLDTISFFAKYFPKQKSDTRVFIKKSFEKTPTKRTVQDFVKHFTVRFKFLEQLLKNRAEMQGLISINRARAKTDKETISVIGAILEIDETKNGHYILQLEDLSGVIKVLIHKDNTDVLEIAKDLVRDEVIGVVGSAGKDIVFANAIIHPDVPLSKELKKSPYDHYAVFFGDAHFCSTDFLETEFNRLLLWLNGKLGTLSQRQIAKKTKYVFFVGDVVEGVSVYPGQEDDLTIKDIKGQYKKAAEYLSKIPSHIKIIICPGNHDVGRIAEPQLPIDKEYAPDLWALPNVIMVSNPSLVSIDKSEDFEGIDVLIYHGYSLIYYSDAIQSIRATGGQKKVDDIMIYLLKCRHLAPTHGSTMYIPDPHEDALLIDEVPDIFVTGHIHRAQSKNYRNVTCINSSGWTAIKEDQEKRGLEPQPARAFTVSLKTREVKAMNFSTTKDASSVAEYRKMKAK